MFLEMLDDILIRIIFLVQILSNFLANFLQMILCWDDFNDKSLFFQYSLKFMIVGW